MNRTKAAYEERARELMLNPEKREKFVRLNVAADTLGACPDCEQPIGGYEYERVNHLSRCQAVQR